jgi:hypothetical protein
LADDIHAVWEMGVVPLWLILLLLLVLLLV